MKILPSEIQKYSMKDKDITNCIKYGRSVKAFYTNRFRAGATRHVERDLGVTQQQFAQYPKEIRVGLVNNKLAIFMEAGSMPAAPNKMSNTERLIRRSCSDARVRNSGKSVTKQTTRNFIKIDKIDSSDKVVEEFLAEHGEITHCQISGLKLEDTGANPLLRPSIDHFISIIDGGSHTASNLRVVAYGINMMKNRHDIKHVMDFVELLRLVGV